MTAVNFKSYPNADATQIRLIDRAARELGDFLVESSADLRAFRLEASHPVLASAAAFVPMANPTGEIARVRERVLAFCRGQGGVLTAASAPEFIHSTVLRFLEPPKNSPDFADEFDAIARTLDLGHIAVDRLLVTFELKPYMRAGRVARSVRLSP